MLSSQIFLQDLDYRIFNYRFSYHGWNNAVRKISTIKHYLISTLKRCIRGGC